MLINLTILLFLTCTNCNLTMKHNNKLITASYPTLINWIAVSITSGLPLQLFL